MDYKERMLDELNELTAKITRLYDYIELTNNNTDLEKQQFEAMCQYRKILALRILELMKKWEVKLNKIGGE